MSPSSQVNSVQCVRVCVMSGPYITCDMERAASSDSRCRLRQATSDNFDWTRIAGRTISGRLSDRRVGTYRYPVTGPDSAQQGYYYIYIEASGQFRDTVARLRHTVIILIHPFDTSLFVTTETKSGFMQRRPLTRVFPLKSPFQAVRLYE